MKVISFINLKGGVGKTTISVNFAYAVAKMYNEKILFIDNDKQGNATDWLRCHDSDKEYGSITHIMMGDVTKDNIELAVQPTVYDHIDLIAGDMGLIEAHAKLIKEENINQATVVREAISGIADKYKLCIIDNPPDINLSVFNTLGITDDVVIVTTTEKDSLDGMYLMLNQITAMKNYNECLNLAGLLLNQYLTSPDTYEILDKLKSEGLPIFNTKIRYASQKAKRHMANARLGNQSLLEVSPNCHVARDIWRFTKEFFGER